MRATTNPLVHGARAPTAAATPRSTQNRSPGIDHGKHSSYAYCGYRCDQCRGTHLEYTRTYDTSNDARGTRWASADDTATGVPHEILYRLRAGTTRGSNQRTIDGIDAGHRRLTSNDPGLRRRASSEDALEPVIRRVYVSVDEAAQLIQLIIDRRGYTLEALATKVGVTAKTLHRLGRHDVERVHDNTMTLLEEVAHREGIAYGFH